MGSVPIYLFFSRSLISSRSCSIRGSAYFESGTATGDGGAASGRAAVPAWATATAIAEAKLNSFGVKPRTL